MGKDEVCKPFGLHIRNLRIEKGLSQERLAELASLDRTYISDVERGNRNISLINIFKLADALQTSAASLLDFSIENRTGASRVVYK